jgi:hypothetical protein
MKNKNKEENEVEEEIKEKPRKGKVWGDPLCEIDF